MIVVIAGLFIATMVAMTLNASAATTTVNFEPDTYTVGDINGQDGWSKTGNYDVKVVNNVGAPATFGTQSLRISNAVASGSFGDQAFSKPIAGEAGETTALNGGMSSGTRTDYFESSWDFASTSTAEQPGLAVVASPDRGDGARMSWVQMTDTPAGLAVNFYGYDTTNGGTCSDLVNFEFSNIASGLNRAVPHKIKITMNFVEGINNDVVKVYIDGLLAHTGTSWEDYFRNCEGPNTRTVDSVLFRMSVAAPGTLNNGFLIDNFSSSNQVPVVPPVVLGSKEECKKDGWKLSELPVFKNQGQCVSSFVKNPKSVR